MIDFRSVEVCTFDCYGTLIDWETGILSALRPLFDRYHIHISDNEILERYAGFEAHAESGDYRSYRMVLRNVIRQFGVKYNFVPSEKEEQCLELSLQNWKPFGDTVESLGKLHTKYRLAIISNIDDDLFAVTAKDLTVKFDEVITASQVKSYKPSKNNFLQAIKRLHVAPDRILHVAQSQFHDISTAKECGMQTVWVDRRIGKQGSGATPTVYAKPDLTVPDLRTLVALTV